LQHAPPVQLIAERIRTRAISLTRIDVYRLLLSYNAREGGVWNHMPASANVPSFSGILELLDGKPRLRRGGVSIDTSMRHNLGEA